MGRRIKEEPYIHRKNIATAAGKLFETQGIRETSMNEIAKVSGYSKATLYVYFQDKEEIIGYLVLESMNKLKQYIASALEGTKAYKAKYLDICWALARYQEEYPFYFNMVQDKINIQFEESQCEEEERETFRVGEEINSLISTFLVNGMMDKAFREQKEPKASIFAVWGMLSGLIEIASNKQDYIQQEMQMNHHDFLENGFLLVYNTIQK